MRSSQSAWLLAITPVMLCSTTIYAPFISLKHKFLYHCIGSPATVLAALLVNLAAAYLLFVLLLKWTERSPRRGVVFWSCFIVLVPFLLLRDEAVLMDRGLPGWLSHGVLLLAFAALAAEVLLWRRGFSAQFERVCHAAQALTAVFSLAWLVTVGQLAYYAVATRGINHEQRLHSDAQTAASNAPDGRSLSGKPRIIWIVLDELGYDQVYGRRLPGLELPAFDQLAAQAVNFTQAVAPGDYTEQVIPALLSGEPAKRVAFTIRGKLLYQNAASQPWQAFQPGNTVFADALQAGYRTALAGWHNPYCRLLSPALDSCFWTSRVDAATSEFDGQASFVTNLLGPARRVAAIFRSAPKGTLNAQGDRFYAFRHMEDVQTLVTASDSLIANTAADFLFVHIPVPHPGGIYDRRRKLMTDSDPHASYEDNLALADRVLAHFRQELTARGEWDPSLVIVMGDHAWRTKLLWTGQRSWTPEDQLASHGGNFDPRPAYLIKLPNEQAGIRIDQSFATLRTRSLIDQVMHGGLKTTADLQAWARQP